MLPEEDCEASIGYLVLTVGIQSCLRQASGYLEVSEVSSRHVEVQEVGSVYLEVPESDLEVREASSDYLGVQLVMQLVSGGAGSKHWVSGGVRV